MPGVQPQPPALPRRLADPRPAIAVATTAWFVAMVVFLVIGAPASWVWTCLFGVLLGFVGFTVMYLQRNAARRGSRLAQKGLL
ncbi:MAG TPA: DUF2530 domain-containing protein [Pseudonocardiaceae bacterium]|nr:DUF2530 domain-containing protein [Pseudonocardiaceae bacterium]